MLRKLICLLMTIALLSCCLLPALAESAARAVVPELSPMTRYEIPDNEAMAFLRRMGVGWNLGNTMEATWDGFTGNDLEIEAHWVGSYTTRADIEQVAAAGFSTLRLPVSWHNHVSGPDHVINPAWLDRVQEIADWALSLDMNVILNIHHDDGIGYYYPDSAHLEDSIHYVRCIWTQLAEHFADYDDRLIFECINEPRLSLSQAYAWNFNQNAAEIKDAAACINTLNQTFVDTVRAGGGHNADRYLMVPGYDASADGATSPLFDLPADAADNRIIVSVHAYTPYSFALDLRGTDKFSLSARKQLTDITSFMNRLYQTYIAKGIPVCIGEFGALKKNDNLQARVDYAAFYTANAISRGIPCNWWDNGAFSGNGELFGLLRRANATWIYPEIVEAMMRYSTLEQIPFK